MANRGQVTAFIIIGVIIVVAVLVAVYISRSAVPRQEDKFRYIGTEEKTLKVRGYVISCLDESLKNAVSYCSGNFPAGGPKCPEYEVNIKDRMQESFCSCIPECKDFSEIENVRVEVQGEFDMEVVLSADKKRVIVTLTYPLLVKEGESENMLGTRESPFTVDYKLEEGSCVQVKIDNRESCRATEEKTVKLLGLILTYKIGDRVAIGSTCIAC
ncbi:hypothetical protein FJZ53_00695 [Candidatus Woesearchaeota archaeon]|nr:hypothetical protein [Candidatus Woesearchaeota archaeon]